MSIEEIISEKFGITVEEVRKNSKRIEECNATYYWNPNNKGLEIPKDPYGRQKMGPTVAFLVTDDGDYVSTWYNISLEKLIEKFKSIKMNRRKKISNLFERFETTNLIDIGMQLHSIFNNNIIRSETQDEKRLDESLSEYQKELLAKKLSEYENDYQEAMKDEEDSKYLLDEITLSKVSAIPAYFKYRDQLNDMKYGYGEIIVSYVPRKADDDLSKIRLTITEGFEIVEEDNSNEASNSTSNDEDDFDINNLELSDLESEQVPTYRTTIDICSDGSIIYGQTYRLSYKKYGQFKDEITTPATIEETHISTVKIEELRDFLMDVFELADLKKSGKQM